MMDWRSTYISSVMTTKTSGASPDKRRKYYEAFKAEALRLPGESCTTPAALLLAASTAGSLSGQ